MKHLEKSWAPDDCWSGGMETINKRWWEISRHHAQAGKLTPISAVRRSSGRYLHWIPRGSKTETDDFHFKMSGYGSALFFFFVVFAGKRHVTTRLASGTQLLKAQHLSANKFGERAFIFDESNVCTEHIGNCFRVLMKLQKIFRDGCSTRGSACSRSSARFSGPSKSTSAIPVSSSS